MKTEIIKIEDNLGIIIPANILHQLNLKAGSEIILSVKDNTIFINRNIRSGWSEAAKKMAEERDDQLLIPDFLNGFDNNEWTWEDAK